MKVIYLDCDGVIANWQGGAQRLFGMPPVAPSEWDSVGAYLADKYDLSLSDGIALMWERINDAGPEWWRDLAVYSSGLELYKRCWAAAPTVFVTSPSSSPSAASGKMMFFQKYNNRLMEARGRTRWTLGEYPVPRADRTVAIMPNKAALAAPSKALVDDSDKKVRAFQSAGGAAFLWPRPWNEAGRGKSPGQVVDAQFEVMDTVVAWATQPAATQ